MEEKKLKLRRPRLRRKRLVPKIEEVVVPKQPTESELAAEKIRVQKRNAAYEKTRKKKTIGFTLEEWAKIESQLDTAEIPFTEFAKHKLLKTKIKFPAALKNEAEKVHAYQKIHSELLAQGNNLNQIARKMNQGDPLTIQLLQQLHAIEKQLAIIEKSV